MRCAHEEDCIRLYVAKILSELREMLVIVTTRVLDHDYTMIAISQCDAMEVNSLDAFFHEYNGGQEE